MFMKGPFRELLPLGQQTIRIRLSESSKVKGVKFLAANQKPQVTRSGPDLLVTTPSILDHEILAIDF
jgi:hypothetical protein